MYKRNRDLQDDDYSMHDICQELLKGNSLSKAKLEAFKEALRKYEEEENNKAGDTDAGKRNP